MTRIVLLDVIAGRTVDRIRAMLPAGFSLDAASVAGPEEVARLLADAEYAIAGFVAVTEPMLAAAPRLRLLHKWGVGTDQFDLDAARARGVIVARTAGSNAVAVAEFTIGLILATMRHLAWAHAELREGRWLPGGLPGRAFQLGGKTVAIVGFGPIGRRVAQLVQGFGCRVLVVAPRLAAAEADALAVSHVTLDQALAQADVLCLHCPLTADTRGLIGRAALLRMKPSAVLINAARGGVVIEADLVWALQTGVIAGAGTDVFDQEPADPANPLLGLRNAVVTPHIAAGTVDSFAPTIRQMFANIAAVAAGGSVPGADRVV